MFTAASPRAGKLVPQKKGIGAYSAFVPNPLPPAPPLYHDTEMRDLIEQANRALGRLDGAIYMLPNPDLFLFMHVRKEAVLSSQIEGIQVSLADLLTFEGMTDERTSLDEAKEVSTYIKAMHYGLKRIKEIPLGIQLLKEVHTRLLEGTKHEDKEPGEFRTAQTWIEGTKPSDAAYVPPPPHEVFQCMKALERFLNTDTPTLIKAGLAHAQFESIHPFLVANGRVGRFMITLVFCHDKVLERPLIFLSQYFKRYRNRYRNEYYERLNAVRRDGDWEGWIKFYLRGIQEMCTQATEAAKAMMNLQEEHREKINTLGKAAPTAIRVLHLLFQQPLISVSYVAKSLGLNTPAVRKVIHHLEKLGILEEVMDKGQDKAYLYTFYRSIIKEGLEV